VTNSLLEPPGLLLSATQKRLRILLDMTEEKRLPTKYFNLEDIELIHSLVSKQWAIDGEPIPPFSTAHSDNLDALIKLPQSDYFGVEQYPSLESKAAIIFYTLNKKHLFLNGNKRMSVACLIIFLFINKKDLNVEQNDLTDKALWLAQTSYNHNFDEIKENIENWLKEKVIDLIPEK
jgi:death-on-curing family protein